MSEPPEISIAISEDEALVLFEWLARFNERTDVPFDDQAEQRVLWNLECQLEARLVAPLRADYSERLGAARDRVRDCVE